MKPSRRQFLKTSALSGLGLIGGHGIFAGPPTTEIMRRPAASALPTYPQIEWQDCEFGIIFHFDISIATRNIRGDNQTREILDPQEYNPDKLDTDQWVATAKKAGARYAIFTATHFGGFLQWQTELYPYGLRQAKWRKGRGDIVSDFMLSCEKYGLRPGLYLSTHRNAWWQVDNHYVNRGKGKGSARQEEYNRICEKMTEELCSRYGRLLQIWYDAGVKTPMEGGPDVLPIFEKLQPNGIFYSSSQRSDIRWVGNEAGHADYPCWATMPAGAFSHNSPKWKEFLGSGVRDGAIWSPAMVDCPLRGANGIHSWFWKPGQENGIYSVDALLNIYEHSVGRNGNMLIGAVINPDGLVPLEDAQRLETFGAMLKQQFSRPVAGIRGEGKEMTIDLPEARTIRQYVIQEDIRLGERVHAYVLKGLTADGSWIKIAEGSCIGHKRIGRIAFGEKLSRVRLQIVESRDLPQIRLFSIF